MKLISFRIRNYKSIVDSSECPVTDGVTIFAGKNEAGKTAILEALEDFGKEGPIGNDATPITGDGSEPTIIATFRVSPETMKAIYNEMQVASTLNDSVDIEIVKEFSGQYRIASPGFARLLPEAESERTALLHNIDFIYSYIQESCAVYSLGDVFVLDLEDVPALQQSVAAFRAEVDEEIEQIKDNEERQLLRKRLETFTTLLPRLEAAQQYRARFFNELYRWMPNFILFSSFDDVFPDAVHVSELERNEWIKDVAAISDLDPKKILSESPQVRKKHHYEVNIQVNKEYKQFWTQAPLELSFDWDTEYLRFWIQEDGHFYTPAQRSKGQQWHLAFLVRCSARAREDVPNIVLIDEPGLYLHAKAQRDVLAALDDFASNTQVLFSTHSPFLLKADHLERIRLVHKTTKRGTRIASSVHALADKETLTPILMAIGLELSSGIASVDKIRNVIVEGPSDLYYLQGFNNFLEKSGINFVFGGGSGNMPVVGTILHGWGCKVLYLFDNDRGKKDGAKNLRRHWKVQEEMIVVIPTESGSIEDVFSHDDFMRCVLPEGSPKYELSNSEYVRKKAWNKVLLAMAFKDRVSGGDVRLDVDTNGRVKSLFADLHRRFKVLLAADQ